ncbi:hypothetical protein POM88_040423 [Heracleum sosnowskyi]|uniref:Uncharacterized protein n=1 Tax=Heracleum sosnowskyi TaxID=360622 RepID=A0AAD8M9U2_9APIA|nr:hypothetical protein POM88_040423 [Heracleum sosnowskyi]
MVRVRRPFGRLMEIWNSDMGLGDIGPQFEIVLEEDINRELADGDVVHPQEDPGVGEEGSSGESDGIGLDDQDVMAAELLMQEPPILGLDSIGPVTGDELRIRRRRSTDIYRKMLHEEG